MKQGISLKWDIKPKQVILKFSRFGIVGLTATIDDSGVTCEGPQFAVSELMKRQNEPIMQLNEAITKRAWDGESLHFSYTQNNKLRTLLYMIDTTCGDFSGIIINTGWYNYTLKKSKGCPLFSGLRVYQADKMIMTISSNYNLSASRKLWIKPNWEKDTCVNQLL